jgi:hypothetical protein
LVVSVALALAAPPTAPPDPAGKGQAPDWLVEDRAGVVRLRLAHAERERPDGGTLVVDPNRRVLEWHGAPGENGCRRSLEVPFARVRALRAEPQGVLRLELRGEADGGWELVPLPHAAWLTRTSAAIAQGFLPDFRNTLVTGPVDDAPLPPSGSAAFMGAQVRADLVPPEVAADVRLAAETVRRALGRTALPAARVYEALHGDAIEVSLDDLAAGAATLEGRAVRVRARVAAEPGGGLALVDGAARVPITPEPEVAALVRAAARGWHDREIEVTGVVRRTSRADGPAPTIAFWQFEGPDRDTAPAIDARTVSLRALVEQAAALSGQTLRVVGKFRGRNLFGDLPGPAPRGGWVIKAKRHAVWVVGRGPSGRGFHLNPALARDTTQWVEVVGTTEMLDGRPVLRARAVALAAPQTFVWNGPRLRSDPHPDVVFTLPLLDEEASARDGRLLVQFSAYMDEETFEGRVRVLLGRGSVPEREARRPRLTYDDVRRVLIVDPAEALPAGGVVEVRLLPGIEDVYGAVLAPSTGAGTDGAVAVLRWRVASAARADGTP